MGYTKKRRVACYSKLFMVLTKKIYCSFQRICTHILKAL
jgi:hypothetical protein